MVVHLIVDNRYVTIENASKKVIRKLEKISSYKVEGYYFSPAYRKHRWDGKEHLLKYSRKYGYRIPTGMLEDVVQELRKNKVKFGVEDIRSRPNKRFNFKLNDEIKLRPYQVEAVKAITKPGNFQGRGILKMPTRSGKTKTAAGIIEALQVKTMFIVPSTLLLYQAQKDLSEALQVPVGIIGDGEHIEENITVATIQTVSSLRTQWSKGSRKGKSEKLSESKYGALIKDYDLVIFDEVHHFSKNSWSNIAMEFNSMYKIGLSATVFLENEKECERGVIYLKACCGNVKIDIPMSRLIKEGYLLQPLVKLYRVYEPQMFGKKWSATLQNKAVYENKKRNRMIAEIAKELVDDGLQVLVISNRKNQTALISELLKKLKLKFVVLTGNDSSIHRRERIKAFMNKEINVLIGTVFGEGIDIPEVEAVINAEAGSDIKKTFQRMRNLTPSEGKAEPVFVDFADLTSSYFAKQSLNRIKYYRTESEFRFELI